MLIAGKKLLEEFAEKHAQTRGSIVSWIQIVEKSTWRTFNDVKQTFPSADCRYNVCVQCRRK